MYYNFDSPFIDCILLHILLQCSTHDQLIERTVQLIQLNEHILQLSQIIELTAQLIQFNELIFNLSSQSTYQTHQTHPTY